MQRHVALLALALLALSAAALAPSQAQALDLQLPIQLGFDYTSNTDKPKEGNTETTSSTTNFSVQLPIIFKFHPKFGVGPAFRFGYFGTSNESSGGGQTTESSSSGNLIGLGLMVRSDIHDFFAAQASFFYDLGSASSESGGTSSPDTDLSGFEFRIDLLGRAKVGQYKTWFEIGPYFFYRSLTLETSVNSATVESERSTIGLGLALQGTFEFGL